MCKNDESMLFNVVNSKEGARHACDLRHVALLTILTLLSDGGIHKNTCDSPSCTAMGQ